MKKKKIITKVTRNKNQKFITIPKDSDIEAGDYVEVIKKEFKDEK